MSLIARAKAWIISKEPVLSAHAAAGAVAIAGEFLVGDTHLVTSTQWSTVAMGVTPLATAALTAASAVVMRRVLSPALDFAARVEAEVSKRTNAFLDQSTVHDAPASAGVTDLDVPDEPVSDVTDVDTALAAAAELAAGATTDDTVEPLSAPQSDPAPVS